MDHSSLPRHPGQLAMDAPACSTLNLKLALSLQAEMCRQAPPLTRSN